MVGTSIRSSVARGVNHGSSPCATAVRSTIRRGEGGGRHTEGGEDGGQVGLGGVRVVALEHEVLQQVGHPLRKGGGNSGGGAGHTGQWGTPSGVVHAEWGRKEGGKSPKSSGEEIGGVVGFSRVEMRNTQTRRTTHQRKYLSAGQSSKLIWASALA